MKPVYPAHIRIDENGTETVHTVTEHNLSVADICREHLKENGLASVGYLTGILHDMGKYTPEFASYITKAAHGEKVVKGSVNHTFAPIKLLFERYGGNENKGIRRIAVEILSFVIGSHHGQFDCIDPEGHSGFEHRINSETVSYEEAKGRFFSEGISEEALDELFDASVKELETVLKKIKCLSENKAKYFFFLSMLCRMLLSELIEADRTDTAAFMKKNPAEISETAEITDWKSYLTFTEEKLSAFPCDTAIQKARKRFSQMCGEYEYKENGIYRLNLPTGGGKTLSSLRAALTIAERFGKKRLIFVTPLLSVLDQNAEIIRKYIHDDSIITEHHSNVVKGNDCAETPDRHEYFSVLWKSPVIITTMVQLLNTLFDGKTESIRRMRALHDSVIIFDEVQSLPHRMISCFNLAVNYLTEFENCAILLCSATQPCFDKVKYPMPVPSDIVPYRKDLWKPFERVNYRFVKEYCEPEEIASMAQRQVLENGSVLVICNKKSQALALYRLLKGGEYALFHLSTSMCMKHRLDQLKMIVNCLNEKRKIICVSTQLVEAGIDFSFGAVIRFQAGLDNIVQSAGRCNRNGEYGEKCPVYVVRLKAENLEHLKDIRDAQHALQNTMADDDFDISSFKTAEDYYYHLFGSMNQGAQDYPLDNTSLLHMLSENKEFCCKSKSSVALMRQAFKTAGNRFMVFEDITTDVIVPYAESVIWIAELNSEKAKWDMEYRKKILERLSLYTVSLFDYQIQKLKENEGIRNILHDGEILELLPGFYSKEYGVDENGEGQYDFWEV